ncbi:type IX secretion system ring subunit PorN/GldN [Mangrovivirga cuniculi]|uniref:Gliding motility protein GldN n=1 Tax=Mangrovivirga cuniculi TaxID=2715131 RepID=A0A4D7JS91_9BACT|nr:gliding motility protein GldN [Mangrovivirga cuniculi]QCK13805.1 gliding motility protein GldN [Mangrovivirga cuniculi]
MKKLSFLLIIISGFALSFSGNAQINSMETPDDAVFTSAEGNTIYKDDIFFRKRVWRRMDLTEKMNRPFFAFNNEITKLIIDKALAGEIDIYENDSLTTKMTVEQFTENMKREVFTAALTEEEKAMGFGEEEESGGDDWGDWGTPEDSGAEGTDAEGTTEESSAVGGDDLFFPSQVTILEIMEDMIFDRKRSRLYWTIQSISLIIPAKEFETGVYRRVGAFKYEDLVELWRENPDQSIWFNRQNSAEHRNLADAFKLRLFDARIIKVDNPEDLQLEDIYSDRKRALIESVNMEQKLMEMEHDLWSF